MFSSVDIEKKAWKENNHVIWSEPNCNYFGRYHCRFLISLDYNCCITVLFSSKQLLKSLGCDIFSSIWKEYCLAQCFSAALQCIITVQFYHIFVLLANNCCFLEITYRTFPFSDVNYFAINCAVLILLFHHKSESINRGTILIW